MHHYYSLDKGWYPAPTLLHTQRNRIILHTPTHTYPYAHACVCNERIKSKQKQNENQIEKQFKSNEKKVSLNKKATG